MKSIVFIIPNNRPACVGAIEQEIADKAENKSIMEEQFLEYFKPQLETENTCSDVKIYKTSATGQSSGSTLERQEGMVADWLKRNPDNAFLADLSFTDLGVSAFRGKNSETGGMSKLLAAAEAGKLTTPE